MSETTMAGGRFLDCRWECRTCQQDGEVRVWARAGDTDVDASERQQQRTREACVTGCALMISGR